MFCTKCGKELENDAVFCPNCGAKVAELEIEEPVIESSENKKPAKCWSVFAKVSKILGIVAIATCWLPFLIGLEAGVSGIVFAILGKHAIDEEAISNRKRGLTMSIVGSIISYVVFLVFILVMVLVYNDEFIDLFRNYDIM